MNATNTTKAPSIQIDIDWASIHINETERSKAKENAARNLRETLERCTIQELIVRHTPEELSDKKFSNKAERIEAIVEMTFREGIPDLAHDIATTYGYFCQDLLRSQKQVITYTEKSHAAGYVAGLRYARDIVQGEVYCHHIYCAANVDSFMFPHLENDIYAGVDRIIQHLQKRADMLEEFLIEGREWECSGGGMDRDIGMWSAIGQRAAYKDIKWCLRYIKEAVVLHDKAKERRKQVTKRICQLVGLSESLVIYGEEITR